MAKDDNVIDQMKKKSAMDEAMAAMAHEGAQVLGEVVLAEGRVEHPLDVAHELVRV